MRIAHQRATTTKIQIKVLVINKKNADFIKICRYIAQFIVAISI